MNDVTYRTPKMRTYMGVEFYRHPRTGYWLTDLPFSDGPGYMADTLAGMKQLIKKGKSKCKANY